MSMKVITRCKKCGKVLEGKVEKAQMFGRCPRCRDKFVLPDPVQHESRKYKRVVIVENEFVPPIPERLTKSIESPLYRVMYTEVPPVEFALNRSTHVPLLDLSEGGMGFFVKADEISEGLFPGDVFTAEMDFPILVQPIFIQVEVRWIDLVKEDQLRHVGVRFYQSDESFKGVLKSLLKYTMSRTGRGDFDKWMAFG